MSIDNLYFKNLKIFNLTFRDHFGMISLSWSEEFKAHTMDPSPKDNITTITSTAQPNHSGWLFLAYLTPYLIPMIILKTCRHCYTGTLECNTLTCHLLYAFASIFIFTFSNFHLLLVLDETFACDLIHSVIHSVRGCWMYMGCFHCWFFSSVI